MSQATSGDIRRSGSHSPRGRTRSASSAALAPLERAPGSDNDVGHVSVSAVKWSLIRRLQDEKALVYSVQERSLAGIQAALRNNSSVPVAPVGPLEGAKLPWHAIDSRGAFKQRWDLLLSFLVCLSRGGFELWLN